ncbi:CYTH domain-containing protein [Flavobacteriaceae bacterium TP-CH-4]|uniref:CYTH domain-containing protein n=1 Tax=Pelagihabitans pacificus TaxID=2696054 RepID=A0A967ARY1_9FLAO|nr:CYTH domain-containing protein [Pelagihabitans pacificus]NHF58882.1 CYTH domain-containing protein [Pelagihabitans pacificus]
MIEIERKYLVTSDAYRGKAISKERIIQGFLNTHPERTVRVRIKGDKAYLTIKGKSNESGTSRYEWEQEMAITDAEKLLEICEEGRIDKIRYSVPFDNQIFEVDEFLGANDGLVIAEVELNNETEYFDKPDWLGKEVTGDIKYYNSQLGKQPFKTWK